MRPRYVLETCLYVDDLEGAEQFYAGVLGLELLTRQPGRHAFFRCGDRMLLLFLPQASSAEDSELPRHGAVGAGHLAFGATAAELEDWMRRLTDSGVAIEQVVQWPRGGRSFYFRDPAGNSLEFAEPGIWGLDSR